MSQLDTFPASVPETDERAQPVAAKKVSRVIFVDLLRLLASFQMLHGHTLDALMAQELRQGPVFAAWSWQRGLVSVGFLFAAGIAFTLSTLGNLPKFKSNRTRVIKRWKRIGWLVLLGYLMHFPAEAWSSDPERARASLHAFLMADVLQCIGFSIGLVQLVMHLSKTRLQVVSFAAVAAVGFFVFAPLADAVSYEGWHRPFANYLTHRGGSLFPLFPWSGFVMAGVAAGALLCPKGARTPPREPVPRVFALTAALYLIWLVAREVPFSLVTEETTRHSVPSFAILKLAAVMSVVCVLALLGLVVKRLPKVLVTLAGESLMLYWFHLMLLYGAGIGLGSVVGRTLPLPQAIAAAATVVVVSITVALWWHRVKKWRDVKMDAWRARKEHRPL